MEPWRDELYHHGVQGMKWGVRNGPPYPLNSSGKDSLNKQRKAASNEGSNTTKKKNKLKNPFTEHKRKKQRLKNLEKARATKKANEEARRKQAEHDANRDNVIRKGSATQISEYKHELTAEEYRQIFERLDNEKKLSEYKAREIRTGMDKAKKAMNTIKDISDMTAKGIDAYNVGVKLVNSLLDTKLPKIEDKRPTSWDDKVKQQQWRKSKVEADRAEKEYEDWEEERKKKKGGK